MITMDVSVIIVNYNTKLLLGDCIKSIYEYTSEIEYEILVVDNNSEDGSCSMIKECFPNVYLIESKENLGFGRANNLASEQAKGKYLFYLNSDTLLRNNSIKIFFDFAESYDGKIGALGAILKRSDNTNCHSYGKFITMGSELKDVLSKYLRFLKNNDFQQPNSVTEPLHVDYITGADLFIPHKVYNDLGGFDPRFFMYCEEVDWQKRMADSNFDRIIIDGPLIIHLEGGSDQGKSRIWSANRLKNIQCSKKIYLSKYNKGIRYGVFRIFYKILWMPIILTLICVKNGGGYKVLLKEI